MNVCKLAIFSPSGSSPEASWCLRSKIALLIPDNERLIIGKFYMMSISIKLVARDNADNVAPDCDVITCSGTTLFVSL